MIPFSPPRIDDKIINEVVDTLKSGWITTGPKTKKFELLIKKYCEAQSVLCVNSATAGLELVLRWFGVGEGDEVIIPAYTYCATANVIIHCGAKPVMVDINPHDFNMSIEAMEAAISSKTKVIMPVDIAGYPCDYSRINAVVNSENLKKLFSPNSEEQKKLGRILVLSDAAHSFGAVYNSNKTGVLTDITVFSFHAVKNLTTAEGGAIVFNMPSSFNNQDLYNYFNIISLHGQTKDALAKQQKGNWQYDVIEAGYKANMTDIQASIGLVEIERYKSDTLVKRKEIFDYYFSFFEKFEWAQLPTYETCTRKSSYHVFLLRIQNIDEKIRNSIIQDIFNNDVSVNVHFQPLPLLSYYKALGYSIDNFPQSYLNYSTVISLPVFYDMTLDMLKKVCETVTNAVVKNIL